MTTFEERLTAIEQEHAEFKHENAELKQKMELQTIAIGGLVNKTILERINEKNDRTLKALEDHDKFTNMQLAELRETLEVQVEGKIAGMQTEMRQGFASVDQRLNDHTTRFDRVETLLAQILTRLPEKP